MCEQARSKNDVEERNSEKKENGQRNKPHVYFVKPETTICTQHTLGINALLVLLVSFIYGCLTRESHERLYVYLTKIARDDGV
jgi:hypothetical protein